MGGSNVGDLASRGAAYGTSDGRGALVVVAGPWEGTTTWWKVAVARMTCPVPRREPFGTTEVASKSPTVTVTVTAPGVRGGRVRLTGNSPESMAPIARLI